MDWLHYGYSLCLSMGIVTCSLSSCGTPTQQTEAGNKDWPIVAPLPHDYITDAHERASYGLIHFYDSIDWHRATLSDSVRLDSGFYNFLSIAIDLHPRKIKDILIYPLEKANGALLLHLIQRYDDWLGTESSVLYSPNHYSWILDWLINSPKIDREIQDRARERLQLICKEYWRRHPKK